MQNFPLFIASFALLLLGEYLPLRAQPTDPRNPGAIVLPELGRMEGELECVTAFPERFGRQIWAVGDVNADGIADWIVSRNRCDTSVQGRGPIEAILYHGKRGGLPPVSSGVRIGPTEIAADCSFIGAGDWDADGHRDIAISQRIIDDPYRLDAYISSIVVFWNDGHGGYSVADTSHLTAPRQRVSILQGADLGLWADVPERCDLDGDGVDDLVVVTYGGQAVDSAGVDAPYVMIYLGERGARWGRGGSVVSPSWELWRRLFYNRVSVIDHDGDGNLDVVLFKDEDGIVRYSPLLADC